jgi:thiol-disulfide isomerase/thioredoxin
MMTEKQVTAPQRTNSTRVLMVAAFSAVLGFAAVYGTLGRPDNGESTSVAQPAAAKVQDEVNNSVSEGAGTKGLSTGAMTTFVFKKAPEELPEIVFVDAGGAAKSLKDFRGKTVLLNLWATWCAPCREEMPALDRLQKELGSDSFEVVALAVDRGGIDAAKKFLDSIKVSNLKLYADATTRSGSALRVIGMPTTILIDKEGREIGRLPGPAVWDSAEAKRLVEASLN